jgi:hypothetical protein
MKKVNYLKKLRLFRNENDPDLVKLRVTGVTRFTRLLAPFVYPAGQHENAPDDGVYELNLMMKESENDTVDVELELDVVFDLKSLPKWVRAIRVNAAENSEIELINPK